VESKESRAGDSGFGLHQEGFVCAIPFRVPKMSKVNEISTRLKIRLAKGEHLNFSPACHSHLSVTRSVRTVLIA
jgi:hypothetical protein